MHDTAVQPRLTSLGITQQEQAALFGNRTRSDPPGLNETVRSTVSNSSELSNIERDRSLNAADFDLVATQTQASPIGQQQRMVTSFPTTTSAQDRTNTVGAAVTVTNNAFDMDELVYQPPSPTRPTAGAGPAVSSHTPSSERPMSPNRRKKMLCVQNLHWCHLPEFRAMYKLCLWAALLNFRI